MGYEDGEDVHSSVGGMVRLSEVLYGLFAVAADTGWGSYALRLAAAIGQSWGCHGGFRGSPGAVWGQS